MPNGFFIGVLFFFGSIRFDPFSLPRNTSMQLSVGTLINTMTHDKSIEVIIDRFGGYTVCLP